MDQSPSQSLLGKNLANGWVVVEMVAPGPAATGGTFCSRYFVEREGERAFMKALDFSRALKEENWTEALQECLQEYHFERDLYIKCRDKKMTRVVVPIDHGTVDSGHPGQLGNVPYIIFEVAENGDFRQVVSGSVGVGVKWIIDALYGIALGLFQLHQSQIAHQDLKPSNVLIFKDSESKLSDLGRASDMSNPFKWDGCRFAGDVNYAPYEIYYGWRVTEFGHRYVVDLYMLGSLIVFGFLGAPLNALLRAKCMSKGFNLGGLDFKEVLPFLVQAFSEVMADLKEVIDRSVPSVSDDVCAICMELCFPDPQKRGVRRNGIHPSATSAQRYVGKLNYLSRKANMARELN